MADGNIKPTTPTWCEVCANMFSAAGYAALWSDGGFTHLDSTALAKSLIDGCRLCKVIGEITTGNYRRHDSGPLVFKASCERVKPAPGKMRLPLTRSDVPLSMDTLMADVWNDGQKRHMLGVSKLAVFTHGGMQWSLSSYSWRPVSCVYSLQLILDSN
jgi:hypothetical protein